MDDVTSCVKEWVRYDEEIRELSSRVNALREKRSESTSRLHDLLASPLDCKIQITGGSLRFTETTSKQALSIKLLTEVLSEYLEPSSVETILQAVNQRRISKKSISLKRIYAPINEQ